MRAGGTLAVSSIWTNLIDCCKPILARRRNRRGPTALQGVSTWIHGDAAVCYFLRSQNSMPRSTRKYTHCCRTAPIPQQGTSSQVGARCCVDGVPTHRRQDAVPALCPKVDAFTPDSGRKPLWRPHPIHCPVCYLLKIASTPVAHCACPRCRRGVDSGCATAGAATRSLNGSKCTP